MDLLKKIIDKSKKVDDLFEKKESLKKFNLKFNVPNFHPRHKSLKSYRYSLLDIGSLNQSKEFNLTKKHLFLIDEQVYNQKFIKNFISKNNYKFIKIKSAENEIKVKTFIDKFIEKNNLLEDKNLTLVVIGGGLLVNVGAYISEKLNYNLILFPTTVLSMADSPGGKVRINLLKKDRAYKHFHKSYYEPNAMFIDKRFLECLPKKQIKVGLVEVIKHGIFQSEKLYSYLLGSGEDLFSKKEKLLKAVLWAASLKKVCLDIDTEENENGSRRILRGGHDFSDRIEEDEMLKIPHGIAVAIGIVNQLEMEGNKKLLEMSKKIFNKLEIPYTLKKYKN